MGGYVQQFWHNPTNLSDTPKPTSYGLWGGGGRLSSGTPCLYSILNEPPKTSSRGQDRCESHCNISFSQRKYDNNKQRNIGESVFNTCEYSSSLWTINTDHVLVKVTGPWWLDSYKTGRERPDHNTLPVYSAKLLDLLAN